MGMIILSFSVMMRSCTCVVERISFMLWTLIHFGMKPVSGSQREDRLQSAAGQRKNCISGIWITGHITGREGTGCNSKNGKASVNYGGWCFFRAETEVRDVSGVGWISEGCEKQYKKILLDGYDRHEGRSVL